MVIRPVNAFIAIEIYNIYVEIISNLDLIMFSRVYNLHPQP